MLPRNRVPTHPGEILLEEFLRPLGVTAIFHAYGGYTDLTELRPGQYVWVWHARKQAGRRGTPPSAAVVMLWSTDPSDKPPDDVRWHRASRRSPSRHADEGRSSPSAR